MGVQTGLGGPNSVQFGPIPHFSPLETHSFWWKSKGGTRLFSLLRVNLIGRGGPKPAWEGSKLAWGVRFGPNWA